MAIVWKDKHNNLYSKGVTRKFGANKIINLYISSMDLKSQHDQVFSVVMPLTVNPKKHNLVKFGQIK